MLRTRKTHHTSLSCLCCRISHPCCDPQSISAGQARLPITSSSRGAQRCCLEHPPCCRPQEGWHCHSHRGRWVTTLLSCQRKGPKKYLVAGIVPNFTSASSHQRLFSSAVRKLIYIFVLELNKKKETKTPLCSCHEGRRVTQELQLLPAPKPLCCWCLSLLHGNDKKKIVKHSSVWRDAEFTIPYTQINSHHSVGK